MFTKLNAPLAERAELASPSWIKTAAAFLKQQPGVPELASPYRLSTRFENSPPHLKQQDLGYTITFTKDAVDIHTGTSADAQWQQVRDYNQSLPFMWLIAEDNPEGDRLLHEYIDGMSQKS